MLKKQKRLNKAIFEEIFKSGANISTTYFIVKKRKTPPSQSSGYAVSVSKKVAPKAVFRNKIRRKVYQALKQQEKTNTQIIFIVKKGIEKLSMAEIQKEISIVM